MKSVDNKRPLKVFLCHAHADRDPVRGLYVRLTQDGVDAWLDKAKLLPGQDWELEIRKAVREADVVVVCLSKQFNQAGFRQKEVRLALDTAMEKPEGEIFIIPARLEECDNLESLRKWHEVDLFEDDGYDNLMQALKLRAKIGKSITSRTQKNTKVGNIPSLPPIIIGREKDAIVVKERLFEETAKIENERSFQNITVIRGWPGVGKTTFTAALAYDDEVNDHFSDGVLWVSLGENPNLLSSLAMWGRVLHVDVIINSQTVEEASTRLANIIRNRKMLLIIDDVWEIEHAIPFEIGGQYCKTLITTRLNLVAQSLAPTSDDIYLLRELTEKKSIELLSRLAPNVVKEYPEASRELVNDLEGLPLALQVAGHLLNVEASYGFSIKDLLQELRDGVKILNAKAPADRVDLTTETIPTVTILLKKSTDRLDKFTRECFAYLGVFAPRPATFDLLAMKNIWQVEDTPSIIRNLVDRGLLEFIEETSRYQLHALLVSHAKSLLIGGGSARTD